MVDITQARGSNKRKPCISGNRIAVVGGGVAGLAFVVSLASIWLERGPEENWGPLPEIILYEREEEINETYRHEAICRAGYSLSLRSGSSMAGIQTAQRMGILDALLAVGVTRDTCEGGWLGLWSQDWKHMVRKRKHAQFGLPVHAMRVQHTDLRMVLLRAAVKHAAVMWGGACTEILRAEHSTGRIRLRFDNRPVEDYDVVVVADGVKGRLHSSTVPDNLRDVSSHTSIVILIAGISRFEHKLPNTFARDWGMVPAGNGCALFVGPMDDRCAYWSLSYRSKTPCTEQRQNMPLEAAKTLLQEAYRLSASFRSDIVRVLLDQTDHATLSVRNSYDTVPFAHGLRNKIPDGVVFIGDSNHAVTPFAGNGANMALRDGYDLAMCLCSCDDVPNAVEAYDAVSMPRARWAARRSRIMVAIVHSHGLAWFVLRVLLFFVSVFMQLWYHSSDAVRGLCSTLIRRAHRQE